MKKLLLMLVRWVVKKYLSDEYHVSRNPRKKEVKNERNN